MFHISRIPGNGGDSPAGEEGRLTVVAPKQEVEDGLQAKDTQEVPADARHPPRVHVFRGHSGLQHALKLDGQRERQFHCVAAGQPLVKHWEGKAGGGGERG